MRKATNQLVCDKIKAGLIIIDQLVALWMSICWCKWKKKDQKNFKIELKEIISRNLNKFTSWFESYILTQKNKHIAIEFHCHFLQKKEGKCQQKAVFLYLYFLWQKNHFEGDFCKLTESYLIFKSKLKPFPEFKA